MLNTGDRNFSLTVGGEEGYNIDFRATVDDAWYSVRLLLEGEGGDRLRIKYHNFSDDNDSVYLAENFKSEKEILDFVGRFRPGFAQLQDRECTKVFKGVRVCASDSSANGDLRFYDAVVDDVTHMKHSINENGEERCECVFLLYWLHGPNAENMTDKGIESICRPHCSELDPKLATFKETAMQKMKKALGKSVTGSFDDLAVYQKPSFAVEKEEFGSWFSSKMVSHEDFIEKIEAQDIQDIDVGGDRKFYLLLVQNIEKGLSSSSISEFIYKQILITPEAYVFPSLPWVPYTNAVILLNCQNDFEKLLGMLQNPDHFIVSFNGRPWVVTEKMLRNDHWKYLLGAEIKSLNRNSSEVKDELKVVSCGSHEYERAKQLRDLFLQFIEHQQGLFKKLCIEEKYIA